MVLGRPKHLSKSVPAGVSSKLATGKRGRFSRKQLNTSKALTFHEQPVCPQTLSLCGSQLGARKCEVKCEPVAGALNWPQKLTGGMTAVNNVPSWPKANKTQSQMWGDKIHV